MAIPNNPLEKRLIHGKQILFFNNREAYVAGIYPDIQTLDGVNGDRSSLNGPIKVDFRPRMALLAKHSNNFFRFWMIFYPNLSKQANLNPTMNCKENPLSATSGGEPFRQRYCPFSYDAASNKWDLNSFNSTYFDKLKLMIDTARYYGIMVQLTLFDRCGTDTGSGTDPLDGCQRWPISPWNSVNNSNGLIKDPARGVNQFYNRSLPGTSLTLGQLQDGYVKHVVQQTMSYENVVYEIMNEPIHSPSDAQHRSAEQLARATWADAITGVIWNLTGGKRFIFYNDHTFAAQNTHARGQDILTWKNTSTLKNYRLLDGVIFHGDASTFNPDDLDPIIHQDKIIQVSSDTFGHEDKSYNLHATRNAFVHYMMFQAEATSEEAADGVGSATPPPILFKLPPFVGRWWKLPEQSTPNYFPHLAHVVNPDATVVDLDQDTDQLPMQGRIASINQETFTSWNDTIHNLATFVYEFLNPGNTMVRFTRNNIVQVFRKLDPGDPLYRFYFKWERISVAPPDPAAPAYYMFIYPDKSLVTHRVIDFVINNRATITNISPTQIFIHSITNNVDSVWNYAFSDRDQQLTLEKADHTLTQTYRRLL